MLWGASTRIEAPLNFLNLGATRPASTQFAASLYVWNATMAQDASFDFTLIATAKTSPWSAYRTRVSLQLQ